MSNHRVENQLGNGEPPSTLMANVKEGAAFAGLRYFDNALWFGGAALGLYVENKFGVPAAAVAPATAATVGAIEYGVSEVAVGLFAEDAPDTSEKSSKFGAVAKEVTALGYAAWGGSTSAVELNNSLGLESTKKRRAAQAATYGVAVSLWTTNLPGFKQGKDVLYAGWEYFVENPAEAIGVGVVGSTAVFGLLKGIKAARTRLKDRKNMPSDPLTTQS